VTKERRDSVATINRTTGWTAGVLPRNNDETDDVARHREHQRHRHSRAAAENRSRNGERDHQIGGAWNRPSAREDLFVAKREIADVRQRCADRPADAADDGNGRAAEWIQ
jgi:hypothetical protein